MEEECIHGLGDPAWCTICNGRKAREDSEKQLIAYMFTAQFDSRCYACNCSIFEGDRIGKTLDGTFVCEGCSDEV